VGKHHLRAKQPHFPLREHPLAAQEHHLPVWEHHFPANEHDFFSNEHHFPVNEHDFPADEHHFFSNEHDFPTNEVMFLFENDMARKLQIFISLANHEILAGHGQKEPVGGVLAAEMRELPAPVALVVGSGVILSAIIGLVPTDRIKQKSPIGCATIF
jgi:hypothetical protein